MAICLLVMYKLFFGMKLLQTLSDLGIQKLKSENLLSMHVICNDSVSTLIEIVRINNKSSAHIVDQFVNTRLSKYSFPNRCIHDNGGEFLGCEFHDILDKNSIKSVPTTVKNPQSNRMCGRMQQMVENVLRIIVQTKA